ncbi:MAG: hypothetical protein ABI851_11340 [Saprospiraceae bacterium]
MKIFLFPIILLLTITSCKIQGLTNDYSKLNDDQKKKITQLTSFEKLDNEQIYKINGSQLNEELKKYPKSIVYIFKNGCTSKLCKPLFVYENYAKENGYKLFLVMNGYAHLNETLEQHVSTTLFSIDNEYYKSNYRSTYMRYFENELSSKPIDTKVKEFLGNIYFFKSNQLEKIIKELPKT